MTIDLDNKYSHMLNDISIKNFEKKLSKVLGKIELSVKLQKTVTNTFKNYNEQQNMERENKMQQLFLAEKELQELEKVFKTKVSIKTIGEK